MSTQGSMPLGCCPLKCSNPHHSKVMGHEISLCESPSYALRDISEALSSHAAYLPDRVHTGTNFAFLDVSFTVIRLSFGLVPNLTVDTVSYHFTF